MRHGGTQPGRVIRRGSRGMAGIALCSRCNVIGRLARCSGAVVTGGAIPYIRRLMGIHDAEESGEVAGVRRGVAGIALRGSRDMERIG